MITQGHDGTPIDSRGDSAGTRTSLGRRFRAASRRAKIVTGSAAVTVVVVLVVVIAGAHGPGRQAATPPVAKNFSLPALGQPGTTVSLARYAGQPVIVNFFASWCEPCQKETPLLARYYESHAGHVNMVGIDSNDEQAAALRFVAKVGVAYPVGVDPFPSSTTTSYGVYALPQTFFLNAEHRIVAHVMGAVTARVLSEDVALMNQRPSQKQG